MHGYSIALFTIVKTEMEMRYIRPYTVQQSVKLKSEYPDWKRGFMWA
jgi:hypothetical protein